MIILRKWLGRYVELYRPEHVERMVRQEDGTFIPCYGLGPLRARVFGIRLPLLWAWDTMALAGKIR